MKPWSMPAACLRAASRVARSNRHLTRWLFQVEVEQRIHDDLWDMTSLAFRKALARIVCDGDRVLELGTGHVGVLGIYCAKLRRVDVLAIDVSDGFINNARRVAAASGASRISFRESNWFSNVEGQFEVVFCNLPYVPTADGERASATQEHRQIWDGGEDGCRHAATILSDVPRFLAPAGRLLLGYNKMYVPRERMLAVIARSPSWKLEQTVRSVVSPSEIFVLSREH